MNVAFPALFLFLVALPGFLFRQFFQRNEVRTANHAPFGAVALKALLCAALFNALVASAVCLAGYEIKLRDVIHLLVGGAAPLNHIEDRLIWLDLHPVTGLGYFALTNGLALVSALLLRWLVRRWELDRVGSPFARAARGDAPWYYLFAGLDQPKNQAADGATVAAVVEYKEGSYLYTGLLDGYEVNEQGQLDRLLLLKAQRRRFEHDREYDAAAQMYQDDKTRFYPIGGDVFVLRYDDVKTLNVTYLSLHKKRQFGGQTPVQVDLGLSTIMHRTGGRNETSKHISARQRTDFPRLVNAD
ncbi:hypothetical protein [Trinickia dinghuensis]|nr:hypothetical protein [Trinickia dinghuensis]